MSKATSMRKLELPKGVELLAPITESQAEILSLEALDFFAKLQREFNKLKAESGRM